MMACVRLDLTRMGHAAPVARSYPAGQQNVYTQTASCKWDPFP